MDKVYSTIAPLNPCTWGTQEEDKAQLANSASAVLHDVALLDLRFDIILDEFAVPCRHSLHRINGGYLLHRGNLTLRQLQLLQYGVVVHDGTRLVIAAVPPCCGDSGACLAASFEHLFSRSLDVASAVANHPVLPEYTFIVYRLPEVMTSQGPNEDDDANNQQQRQAQRPEALFRLVYRNVDSHSTSATTAKSTAEFNTAAEPEYKLVAVLVSSARYYAELQRASQYRRDWLAHSAKTRASQELSSPPSEALSHDVSASYLLPEPIAEQLRRTSPLSKLCTLFAYVSERFTPLDEDVTAPANAAVRNDIESLFAHGDPVADSATANRDETAETKGDVLRTGVHKMNGSDPWSYQYTRDGARLIRRLEVVERTKAALQSWRDGALDLTETVVSQPQRSKRAKVIDAHSSRPPLSVQVQRVRCARLLLMPSHHEIPTQVSENEILSFLPSESPSSSLSSANAKNSFPAVVYASPAAERLRRWILQGLIAAEVHGIHAVFLDLDPVSMLLPCVEFLAQRDLSAATYVDDGDTEDEDITAQLRYKRALFLVCQAAIETVERFVRHSGLVWKVTVAVSEASAAAGTATTTIPALAEASFTSWCAGMLELIRNAETQREKAALRNTLSFADEDGETANAAAVITVSDRNSLVCADGRPSVDNLSASQQLALRTQEVVDRAVMLYSYEATGPAAPLPLHVVTKARAVGVKVSDTELYVLFQLFCDAAKRRDRLLPASALVDVLTEEWTMNASKRRLYTATPRRLVCPLDSCGVPVTRARVQRFLQPFLDVMRDSPLEHYHTTMDGALNGSPQLLNYAQFSMVMFAIAKM